MTDNDDTRRLLDSLANFGLGVIGIGCFVVICALMVPYLAFVGVRYIGATMRERGMF